MKSNRLKYLILLAEKYPNTEEAAKEIALQSTSLNLTCGVDVFLSDIHGEHEAFQHVLRNGSGVIKSKVREIYGNELSNKEINVLCSIIYYPLRKLRLIREEQSDMPSYYLSLLVRMIKIAQQLGSIYSDRRLRRLLPKTYGDIILELVAGRAIGEDQDYHVDILKSIIEIGQSDFLVRGLSTFIQRLAIHKIHIIGDVYDRGPGADIIVDELEKHHAVDFQWGNHDIVWMGAARGSLACMASVLRLSLRYANTDTLEKGYGIHLMPLASFAIEHYKNDKSIVFDPKVEPTELLNTSEKWLSRLMHKAITMIEFKLEGQLIKGRPEFGMNHRLLLDKINPVEGNIALGDGVYPLKDWFMPTLRADDPYALTEEEEELIAKLSASFLKSDRLQRHARFLFEQGGMYNVTNQNLLYHGCIPLQPDGSLRSVDLGEGPLKGRALMDFFDRQMKIAFSGVDDSPEQRYANDLFWYLWAGPFSPLFGKDKMATFERYFLTDEVPKSEVKDYYYDYRDDAKACEMILGEFGLKDKNCVILNGHVPVSVKEGESPIKADGKLIVIDGGFSKAYQDITGIAGYTLMQNAHGRQLIAHEPFESTEKAIIEEKDIAFSTTVLDQSMVKKKVRDLDDGKMIQMRIKDLKALIKAFNTGQIKEQSVTG